MAEIKIALPLHGDYVVTQEFGENPERYKDWTPGHEGRDYACPIGTPVYASGFGTVAGIKLGDRYYGDYVIVDHGEYETYYVHLSAVRCELNDTVYPTTVIALSGNTGNSTGPHLHHGLRVRPGHKQYIAKWRGWIDPKKHYYSGTVEPPVDPGVTPVLSFPVFPKLPRARYLRVSPLNVRRGPSTLFDVCGSVMHNQEFFVLGYERDKQGNYWLAIGHRQYVAMTHGGQTLCEFIEE